MRRSDGRLSVELVLDGLGRRKAELFGSGNLHGLAGGGVTTFTGRAVLDLELAKAVDGNLVTGDRGLDDGGKDTVDELAGISLADVVAGSDTVGEVVLRHPHLEDGTNPPPEHVLGMAEITLGIYRRSCRLTDLIRTGRLAYCEWKIRCEINNDVSNCMRQIDDSLHMVTR